MKITKSLFAFLLAGLLISCEKEEADLIVKDQIGGYVQKGPFINGTSIVVSELNHKLIPTGRNFNTQIVDNKGSFSINDVRLNSKYVELKADGFYFNEVFGSTSAAPLTLYALSDLSDKSSINVNVLSYLEKARVEFLIGQGKAFNEAKSQAQKEILGIFNINENNTTQSETLDITKAGDNNAMLLAVSVILQGNRSVAELSELLANLSTDIREDGIVNSQTLGSKLINDVKYLDLTKVRQHMQSRYADMGVEISTPDFEKYVKNFIDKTSFAYSVGFTYPSNGLYGNNILNLANNTSFSSTQKYSLAAHVPAGSSLKVVLKAVDGLWYYNATSNTGWQAGNFDSGTNTQTFTASKTGEAIDLELALSQSGSFIVELYENNSPQPSITKTINWAQTSVLTYPATGNWGTNLLSVTDGSTVTAQEYSLAVSLPADNEYTTEVKLLLDGTGSFTLDQNKLQNWQYNQTSSKELILKCSGKGITADMSIILSGEGTLSIQSIDINKSIGWK